MSQIYRFDITLTGDRGGSQRAEQEQRVVLMRRSSAVRLAGIVGLTGLGVLAAGCSSGQPAPTTSAFAGAAAPAGSWTDPNGNLANTRDADSLISSANVSQLREA